jgi:hypothetical protein
MSHLNNEDCDLYVNENSNPTKTNYTYRDISSLTNAKITIPQAGNTLHYVGVFGYRGCHYTLSAKLVSFYILQVTIKFFKNKLFYVKNKGKFIVF